VPLTSKSLAEIHSILKIAERERNFEAQITLRVSEIRGPFGEKPFAKRVVGPDPTLKRQGPFRAHADPGSADFDHLGVDERQNS